MKANSKISRTCKGLLLSSVMFCSVYSYAQHRGAVLADPKLGNITISDLSGLQLNAAYIQAGEFIKIKIPVINVNHGQGLPAGTCKIKIGLGSKLSLDPSYNLNSGTTNSYFTWSAAANGGQTQITGELVASLPASVTEVELALKVKGTALGKSTITVNFLVTNHNNIVIVSDEDGSNNTSFLPYTVTNKPAPVSVTTINNIVKDGCSLQVSFSSDAEINLDRYEVEVSKDGSVFEKVSSVAAIGNAGYITSFELLPAMQVSKLAVRIKAIMTNGRILLSEIKNTDAVCKVKPVKLSVYPNPAAAISHVTISATEGIFNGKYKLRMTDMAGKTVVLKDITLNGTQNFLFEFGNIAAGKYLIQVSDIDNVRLGLLQFEKL